MNYSIDRTFDPSSPEFQQYLVDDDINLYELVPDDIPVGFSNLKDDRYLAGTERYDFDFFAKETWGVRVRTFDRGNVTCIVRKNQETVIKSYTWLFFKEGTLAAEKEAARKYLKEYKESVHGDIDAYILSLSLSDAIKEKFLLRSGLIVEKTSYASDVESSQRLALQGRYENDDDHYRQVIVLATDRSRDDEPYYYSQWVSDNRVQYTLLGVEPVINPEPAATQSRFEIDLPENVSADSVVQAQLNLITSGIPSSCGKMTRVQNKVLTVGGWIEFKVTWLSKVVKIGCVKVTIKYPKVETRTATLTVYFYFSMPEEYGPAIIKLVTSCAIKSVLAGGVMGLLTGNLAVAIVVFKEYLIDCIKNEALNCVHPGLLKLKECSKWV